MMATTVRPRSVATRLADGLYYTTVAHALVDTTAYAHYTYI